MDTEISSCGQVRICGRLPVWLMTASCSPRKLEAQFMARKSIGSVLSTSAMKSPPLLVWFEGSISGASVSAAVFGGAKRLASRAAGACAAAAITGEASDAAAAATGALFRNLRRPAAASRDLIGIEVSRPGQWDRLDEQVGQQFACARNDGVGIEIADAGGAQHVFVQEEVAARGPGVGAQDRVRGIGDDLRAPALLRAHARDHLQRGGQDHRPGPQREDDPG